MNAEHALRPRCSAKRKYDGEPCTKPAMVNGKCAYHGGKTPKGAAWHKARWPNRDSPDLEPKLATKLKALAKRKKAKAECLARRTPEERAAHVEWQKTHKPGSPEARAAAREERRQAREARARLEAGESVASRSPELQELDAMIAVLKHRIADQQARTENGAAADMDALGAFG